MTVDWSVRFADILKIVAVAAGLAILYGQLTVKVDSALDTVNRTQRQTQRIEHYLAQKDPTYYRTITENGDSDPR